MAARYRYAGAFLASGVTQQVGPYLFDVQPGHMGMLELDVTKFTAGIEKARDVLIMSLQDFTVPGRTVGRANLEYLNGNVYYPTRPQPLGDVSVTFRDFVTTPTRAILHQWFSWVYDETSGLMQPTSTLKTTGHLLLFGHNGEMNRHARLIGVWPQDEPQIAVAFAKGDVITMQIKLSVDRLEWQPSLWSPQVSAPSVA